MPGRLRKPRRTLGPSIKATVVRLRRDGGSLALQVQTARPAPGSAPSSSKRPLGGGLKTNPNNTAGTDKDTESLHIRNLSFR